ncbi:preprotein translocase subunit SecY [Maricaulis sp.]|uniref:preprotein translocase subunit SecY n=1 Tax=unclassified Maricaulis TaxID=2632371 RepID=UPI001B1C84EA|nr:preprotein translocase subunit SecY [Maricaulis sp.]
MASAAQQLAANMNFGSFAKAKELQQRILFTIGILILYRVGTYVPVPGIDPTRYAAMFDQNSQGILSMFNMLGGGAVERMAIFALNVMPYISASIIMQLMSATIPSLEKLKKEGGEAGRKQINQYTRYLTVLLATGQALAIAVGMNSIDPNTGQALAVNPGLFFLVSTVTTLVGGTMLLLWLGEQITARGIGNGVSLIIFAGIIAAVPSLIGGAFAAAESGTLSGGVFLGGVALVLAGLTLVVFVERSQRRLLVQYPKRQQGNRMMGGESSFLPLKLNTAGVIPPIFASSLLFMPQTMASFNTQAASGPLANIIAYLQAGSPTFLIVYAAMIIFFCFFYTSVVFNPEDTADNLRKYGGFLPGIRPGKRTAEYLDYVLSRLTLIGALYLTLICVVPMMISPNTALGGTSILIVVSVTMDTISQIQSHLLAHQYEGLIKKSKLRGRKR